MGRPELVVVILCLLFFYYQSKNAKMLKLMTLHNFIAAILFSIV